MNGPEWLDTYRLVILLIGVICLVWIFIREMRRR